MDMHWSFRLFLFSLVPCNLIFPYYDHPIVLVWTYKSYISLLSSSTILLLHLTSFSVGKQPSLVYFNFLISLRSILSYPYAGDILSLDTKALGFCNILHKAFSITHRKAFHHQGTKYIRYLAFIALFVSP